MNSIRLPSLLLIIILSLASPHSSIVATGETVPPNKNFQDFIVELHVNDPDFYGATRLVTCPGALVSFDWILTSYKCIRSLGAPEHVEYWISSRGEWTKIPRHNIKTKLLNSALVDYYPKRDKFLGLRHGLALVKVDPQLMRQKGMKPVCLPETVVGGTKPSNIVSGTFYAPEVQKESLKYTVQKQVSCNHKMSRICSVGLGQKPREGTPFVGKSHRASPKVCKGTWMMFGVHSAIYDPWSDSRCRGPRESQNVFVRFDVDNELTSWLRSVVGERS